MFATIATIETVVAERRRQAEEARVRSALSTTDRRKRIGLLAGLLCGAILLAACGGNSAPVASPITEAEAVEMAENALEAFNRGDYAAWSRDWSQTMKSVIDEKAFLSFREDYHDTLGDYVAITGVAGAQGKASGTYRWTYDIAFERGEYRMWFGFKSGSPLIEGVSFEEPSA